MCFVKLPEISERRGDVFVSGGKIRTQANNLALRVQRGDEIARKKLQNTTPVRPKPNQRIVWAGAHCLPQRLERFLSIAPEPEYATKHADDKGTIWIEGNRSAGLGDRRLPFAAPPHHMREHGMGDRILFV